MESETVNKGKNIAIISYITWIGTIIAFVMNNNDKNTFASFHIRQMIGLGILSILNTFVLTRFMGYFITSRIGIVLFILWIIGFIGAIKGEEKKVPVLGDMFQQWFKDIG